jgi:UDP-N-acetyl-D-galactosamine dehydrogenase
MKFDLELKDARPAVVGLGYVGLPLALVLARRYPTLGFDIAAERIARLEAGHDDSGEVSDAELIERQQLQFSADRPRLRECNVFIIAVPTPVTAQKYPDLSPLSAASVTVAHALKRGDIVIYESTVYPGATEEVCVPVLEGTSGLRCNEDFFVGYSPERINPGDKNRRLPDIVKVTSGSTPEAAAFVDALYRSIIPAGTHLAPSIRVAEAAKAIENTQRDVNIALMNELAQIFARLNLDTEAVLKAAGTKWNFLPFRPGLVGGHCIGVDPYYLIHKAEDVGVYPELIRAARRINDRMSEYVVGRILALLAKHRINVAGAKILVLGFTFKEDCPDLRNTRVVEIVRELAGLNAEIDIHDPWADPAECEREYALPLTAEPRSGDYDCVVVAVGHYQFRDLGAEGIRAYAKPDGVVYDIKYVLPNDAAEARL